MDTLTDSCTLDLSPVAAALAGEAARTDIPPAPEPPPFNVPLSLLAEADGAGTTEIFHGFYDGEFWYAYDLPAGGGWRVLAWERGYAAMATGLRDRARLTAPPVLSPVCVLLP